MMDEAGVRCPVCGGDCRPDFQIDGYDISGCRSCGHRFVDLDLNARHAEEQYGDDYFFSGGAGYPDYLRLSEIVIEHGGRYAEVLARHMPAGRVLDIGAASGFLLRGLVDHGWSGMGLEPNARMARYGREHVGVDVRCGTLENFEAEDLFDLVSMVQVIGHFYDLAAAMSAVAKATKPDGYCLIEYWDRRSLPARVFGKTWHEYSPPSVLHWFARDDLDILLGRHGFVRIASGTPRKYIMGAHIKSLMEYKAASLNWGGWLPRALGLIPDKIRLRYPAFDLRWALYRKAESGREAE
jgi:SAM-dependent methyltransferase